MAHVVSQRAGLGRGRRKVTLHEIGKRHGITRERVRQIEQSFWECVMAETNQAPIRTTDPSGHERSRIMTEHWRTWFSAALVCDLICRSAKMSEAIRSERAPRLRFLAKCAGVPMVCPPNTGLLVVGIEPREFNRALPEPVSDDWLSKAGIASSIARHSTICLSARDVLIVAEALCKTTRSDLLVIERVIMALRKLGGPSHFNKITETHNLMFPEKPLNERSVHAALGREECGVVWVGTRGTYALKEWGFDRPSKGLYDTVAEIVKSNYYSTGKPVSWNVIFAEVGRNRRVVNKNSVLMAACFNPQVLEVARRFFVPRASAPEAPETETPDGLDQLLREFGAGS